jgi:hypothetical protein
LTSGGRDRAAADDALLDRLGDGVGLGPGQLPVGHRGIEPLLERGGPLGLPLRPELGQCRGHLGLLDPELLRQRLGQGGITLLGGLVGGPIRALVVDGLQCVPDLVLADAQLAGQLGDLGVTAEPVAPPLVTAGAVRVRGGRAAGGGRGVRGRGGVGRGHPGDADTGAQGEHSGGDRHRGLLRCHVYSFVVGMTGATMGSGAGTVLGGTWQEPRNRPPSGCTTGRRPRRRCPRSGWPRPSAGRRRAAGAAATRAAARSSTPPRPAPVERSG